MNQAVTFKSGGLHCDNVECDWADETIQFEDYQSHIDAPCPKCGENILTQADFDTAQEIKDFAEFMQHLAEKIDLPVDDTDERRVVVEFKGDGSGKVNVKLAK